MNILKLNYNINNNLSVIEQRIQLDIILYFCYKFLVKYL